MREPLGVIRAAACLVAAFFSTSAWALVPVAEIKVTSGALITWKKSAGIPLGAADSGGVSQRAVHLTGEVPERFTVVSEYMDPKRVVVTSKDEPANRTKRLDITVFTSGNKTSVELMFVDAKGVIEKSNFDVVIAQWDEFIQLEKRGASRPFWVTLGPWIPATHMTGYSVPLAINLLIGAELNGGVKLMKSPLGDHRFEVGVMGRYSFAPLLSLPEASWAIRFLDIAAKGSVLIPFRTETLTLLADLGWAYRTSFSGEVPYAFGYQSIMETRAGATVRAVLGLHHILNVSAYFGLVGDYGFGIASLDNREFGASVEWSALLPHGHRIVTRADASYLQLSLNGQVLNTLVSGLSLSYGL